jgi:hypothetical protein
MLQIPYTSNLLVSIQYPGQAAHASRATSADAIHFRLTIVARGFGPSVVTKAR